MAGSRQFQQTRQAQQKLTAHTFVVPEPEQQHRRQAQTQVGVREQPQPQQYRQEQEQDDTFSLQVRQFMQRLIVDYMVAAGGVLPQVSEDALFNVVATVFTVEERLRHRHRHRHQLNIIFNPPISANTNSSNRGTAAATATAGSVSADNASSGNTMDNIFARFPTTLSAALARRVDGTPAANEGDGNNLSQSVAGAPSAPASQMGPSPAPAPAPAPARPLTWRTAHSPHHRQPASDADAHRDKDRQAKDGNGNRNDKNTNKKGNYRGMYARCQPEEVGTGYNYVQNFGEEAERLIRQYSSFPLWERGPKFYEDCVAFVALLLAWRNFVLFADAGVATATATAGQSGGQSRYHRYVALPTEKMRLEINLQSARLRTTGADSVVAALRRAGILVTARAANVGEQTVLPLWSSETEVETVPTTTTTTTTITTENREGEEYDEYVPVEQVARYKARAARLMTYEGGATYGFWNSRVFQPNTVYYRLADGIRLSPGFESEGSIGARPFNPFPPKLKAHTFSLGFQSQNSQAFGGGAQTQDATTESVESGIVTSTAEAKAEAGAGWNSIQSQASAVENHQLQPQLPLAAAAAETNNYYSSLAQIGIESGMVSQASSSVRRNQSSQAKHSTDRRPTEDRLTPDSTAFFPCSFDDDLKNNDDDDEQVSNAYIRASAKTGNRNRLLSSKEGTGTRTEPDQNFNPTRPLAEAELSNATAAAAAAALEAKATTEVSADGCLPLLGSVEFETKAVTTALTNSASASASASASSTRHTHTDRLTVLLEGLEPDRLEVYNILHYAYLRLTVTGTDTVASDVNGSQSKSKSKGMPDSTVSVGQQLREEHLSQASAASSSSSATAHRNGDVALPYSMPPRNPEVKVEQMSREQALYFARLPEEVLSKATVTRLVDEWVRQYVDGYWAKWNRPTGMLVSWLKNEANGGSAQTGLYSSAEPAQSQSQSIVTGGSGTAVGSEAQPSYGCGKNLNNQNPTTGGRGVGRSQFQSRNRNRNQNQTYNQSQHQNRNRKDVNSSWLLPSLPVDEDTDNNLEQAEAEIRHADADITCPPSLTHTHAQMVDSEEMQMPDASGFGSEPEAEAEAVFTGAPAQMLKADPAPAQAQVGNLSSASASASVSTSKGRGRGRVGRALDPEPEKLNESWGEIVDVFLKKHSITFEKFRPALQEASLEYDLASRVLSVRFGRMLRASKESGRKWMLDTLQREVESQFPSSTYNEVVLIMP
jgi:hypothetical protein